MKIALIGYGKMGRAVEAIAEEYNQVKGNEPIEIGLRIDLENKEEFTVDSLKGIDVAVEFSSPESAVANIKKCLDAGVPVVVGTTGWYSHLDEVIEYCKEKDGTLLYTPNFSVGVNMLFELNQKLAAIMKGREGYKVTINESHHTEKLDAPSGTAISLAEQIMEKNPVYTAWIKGKSDNEETIGIVSFRESGVPGTHVINYMAEEDEITVIHKAHNRRGFATGAFNAVKWVHGKKGIFNMKDVLALNES
jgi:4-hydroxy-tetrahydrodipicolinate reductase